MIETSFLSLADIVYFIQKRRVALIKLLIVVWSVSCLLFLFKEPRYLAEASFQDSGNAITEDPMKVLQSSLPSLESGIEKGKALFWLGSLPMLQAVVKKEALQLQLNTRSICHALSNQLHAQFNTPQYQLQCALLDNICNLHTDAALSCDIRFDILNEHAIKVSLGRQSNTFEVPGMCSLNGIEFKLRHLFAPELVGKTLYFHITPFQSSLLKLKQQLKRKHNKDNRSIIELKYLHFSKSKARSVLNEVMLSFTRHLKQASKELLDEQMQYLMTRQNALFGQLVDAMREHVGYFHANMESHGVMTTSDWLTKKGSLDLSFEDQLNAIEEQIKRQTLLYPGQENQKWIEHVLDLQKERDRLAQHLAGVTPPSQLLNYDASTCQSLLATNHQKMEENAVGVHQFATLIKEVQEDTFAISGLSVVFTDPIARELVQKGVRLTERLEDLSLLSQREQQQIQLELKNVRKTLKEMLEQRLKLLELEKQNLEQHRLILEQSYLAALDRDIAAMQEQNAHFVQVKTEELKRRKDILSAKQHALAKEKELIPKRWMSETLLKLQSDLNVATLENLSHIVESTNIKHHLQAIEAKPIEWGYDHNKRWTLFPFVSATLVSMGVLMVYIMRILILGLYRGLPISPSMVMQLGGQWCGQLKLSGWGREKEIIGNDHLFRQMMIEIDQGKYIALFQGDSWIYAKALAKQYEMMGEKVLVIDTCQGVMRTRSELQKMHVMNDPYSLMKLVSFEGFNVIKTKYKDYDRIIVSFDLSVETLEANKAVDVFDKIIFTLSHTPLQQLRHLLTHRKVLFVEG